MTLVKWEHIQFSTEFYVEIAQNKVISISQAHLEHFYEFLREKSTVEEIVSIIENFCKNIVIAKYASHLPSSCINNLTIDIIHLYLHPDYKPYKPKIVGLIEMDSSYLVLKSERPKKPDFTISEIDVYILENDSEARYKLWDKDFPEEFLQNKDNYEGIKDFLENMKECEKDI